MSAFFGSCRRMVSTSLRVVGSLWLAVAVMTTLAFAMGWATFLEREMGTPVAQYLVYAAGWFYFLVGVLAVNILCSAINRVPKLFFREKNADGTTGKLRVERRLIPFFIAHTGVLLLVLGCLTTALKSVRAQTIISEADATETAIATDDRLFQIELASLDRKDAKPTSVEIPFSGGPLNWRDYKSAENWNRDVAEPLLKLKPEGKFFQDLAKGASKWSQRAAQRCAKLARKAKPGVVYDKDGLKLELLDYWTIADFIPVPPLKGKFSARQEDGTYAEQEFSLPFSLNLSSPISDPLASSRRAQRATASNGVRIVYMIADSQRDVEAFLQTAPEKQEPDAKSTERPNDEKRANNYVVLLLDGVRYQINLADVVGLERYGDLESQRETLSLQKGEIERRLQQEIDRTDVSAEEKDSAKPLATTSRDDLVRQTGELRELSAKMTGFADAATEPNADEKAIKEFSDVRKEFERKRVENYLATTWMQLEEATATSSEFRETLQRMLDQTAKRANEVDALCEATRLGDSGWTIVGFETSPTVVQGTEELQGWSAALQLSSPQGETVRLSLYSDVYERNVFPTNERAFGALWTEEAGGSDNEFGRPWSKGLGKPKLELLQTISGKLYYRYNNGLNDVTTGELKLEQTDAELGTYKTSTAQTPKSDQKDSLESFSLTEFCLQDEIGVRLAPAPFQKDLANEFYGKAKVRLTLDDAQETFLLRTIPLESVTKEQIPYLERHIVSSKRQATIRLTDREIQLGTALYVKKFAATYEPGSSTAASFSSLTRALPPGLTRDEQRQAVLENPERDALIQMNRPGVVKAPGSNRVYWAYQDSFRGPFKPGDEQFDSIVEGKLIPGETTPREEIYQTIITLNDDPGRGMKYLGCLLIVWGTATLVYRRKKDARTGGQALDRADDANQTSVEFPAPAQSGRASLALLFVLALLATAAFLTNRVNADPTAAKEQNVKPQSASNAQIDWTPWRLMPVYDGGRRQPLNTFAEILVRETTGSSAPVFLLPEETLKRLEGDKPLNFPSLPDFLKDLESDANKGEQTDEKLKAQRAEREAWYREVANQAVERQRAIAKRLRALFPRGYAKFHAAELLFSWLTEPELWEYVPFIDDPKGEIATKVLALAQEHGAARAYRLAPSDFDALDANGRSRVEVFRSQARLDEKEAKTLKALDKFEERLAAYRAATFLPTQTPSARPASYLNKILYGAGMGMGMGMGGFQQSSRSPLAQLDDAAKSIERALTREKRALRKNSPFNDKEYILRRRTSAANAKSSESNASSEEPLALARQIAMLAQIGSRSSLVVSSALFERLLVTLTDTLDELRTHRNEVLAEEKFSLEYRRQLQRVVSSLQEVVDNLELAYLSLTSENVKTLAIAPIVRQSLFRAASDQASPWVPIQTFLWAADPAYARFVDPTVATEEDAKKWREPVDPNNPLGALPSEREKIEPFDELVDSLQKTLDNSDYERPAARAFLEAAKIYRDRNAENRAARFNDAMKTFTTELRALAERVEPLRERLAEKEIADQPTREEFLRKTCYDVPRGLKAELFYYRLNAFFWNWVACLAALVAFVVSYLRQIVARIRSKETLNERLFFTLGIAFLACSCAVAFLGGAVRAYITGWAPVANMFETVVLLAFLIAAIAIGYALAPAWSRPYLNAWRATAAPWLVEDKNDKTIAKTFLAPRLLLIFGCFYLAYRVWRSGQPAEVDVVRAMAQTLQNAFAMKGALDSFAVFATFMFVVWAVPRFIVALLALACFPKKTLARTDLAEKFPGQSVWTVIGSEIAQRKAFITASTVVALAVAAAAYFNSVEFNPNIRPLMAVLRSNFWLTIHVFAIIVSYALGSIAWVLALVSLSAYIFGKYGHTNDSERVAAENAPAVKAPRLERRKGRRERAKDGSNSAQTAPVKEQVPSVRERFEPGYAIKTAPIIAVMIRSAVLFLTAGIILGARWADFSWGRFWSWDPKEVWALVTLLIYLVVLHANKIGGGRRFLMAQGANFGALAIIMTWYGLSFVMGGGGRHAYAAGESNKVAALYALLGVNILWSVLALVRYLVEKARAKRRRVKNVDA